MTAVVTGQLTATLRTRAEEARRGERETAALARASWAVAAQVDRDQALAEVLRRLDDVLPLLSGAIFNDDREGGPTLLAELAAGECNWRAPASRRAVEFVLGEGLAVNWEGKSNHWRKALPDSPAGALYLPLTIENRVLGVLCLQPRVSAELSQQERRLVQSLASHAAIVLERDRLLQAETRARALAEADRLKTALLSMVSHDFRSPLTSIKAAVSGLLHDGSGPEVRRELLQGIDQETDRLNGMVGNILTLSRLEADAWRPNCEPTPIAEWFGATLSSLGAEENARIRVCIEPGLFEPEIDPVQMVQVLRNLLENALKYSPPGSVVELSADKDGDRLLVKVADRGMGLPEGPEGETRIFEPFFRAAHLRESSVPGVGIGLAVCRGLVEAHHGILTARRRSGGGTVLEISLPVRSDRR